MKIIAYIIIFLELSFAFCFVAKSEPSIIHRLSDRDLFVMAPNNSIVSLELSKEIAIKLAEIYLVNIYGERVLKQKPWVIEYNDDNWIVKGQLPKGMLGGVAEIEIRRTDGKILRYTHGK